MSEDPIVEEVRTHRAAIAREHGDDLKSVVAALKRRERKDGRKVVSVSTKPDTAKPSRRKAG